MMSIQNPDQLIHHLKLEPLPGEGGYFRLMYRSQYSSAIYYLITHNNFSALHRLKYDEVFHFYLGDPVEMIQIKSNGELKKITIGSSILNGEELQIVAEAGAWQGTRLKDGGKWALLGTTMAPRYEDSEFELGDRNELMKLFPHHGDLIKNYTRSVAQ